MIKIDGVVINNEKVNYIKVARKGFYIPNPHNASAIDDRCWTIQVSFESGNFITIGEYSTEGYAQDILNELKILY